jgi:hypothetical protein
VKYLGVIFDKKITWKVHTETVAKVLLIFLSIYPILKSERLSVGAKLIIYKALIRSMLTCACPAWEFAGDSYLLKLQRLQNRVLRTSGNLPMHIRFANYIGHLRFHIYIITLPNYARRNQALYAIMSTLLFAPLAKAKHVTENLNDSNLVAVRDTIDQSIV